MASRTEVKVVRSLRRQLATLILSACAISIAMADGTASLTSSVIGDGALEYASGSIGVNVAAGDDNTQLNATAIATGNAAVWAQQSVSVRVEQENGPMSVRIEGDAFANASGLLGVNQASGLGNAQMNVVAIAVGSGQEVTDAELAQAVSVSYGPDASAATSSAASRAATVDDTAFSRAKGVVQVNQSAGIGNTTRNTFSLRAPMDGG